MNPVNMLEAKSQLSKLVDALERGLEREIVIARNGKPVARLLPVERCPTPLRIGLARGQFEVPDNIDASNEEIHRLFGCGNASGADD